MRLPVRRFDVRWFDVRRFDMRRFDVLFIERRTVPRKYGLYIFRLREHFGTPSRLRAARQNGQIRGSVLRCLMAARNPQIDVIKTFLSHAGYTVHTGPTPTEREPLPLRLNRL